MESHLITRQELLVAAESARSFEEGLGWDNWFDSSGNP